MKPSEALNLNRTAIRRIVESYHAHNARVFGSVLHNQDTDNSDLYPFHLKVPIWRVSLPGCNARRKPQRYPVVSRGFATPQCARQTSLQSVSSGGTGIDILIDPTPQTTLFDIGAIRHELGKLLGVSVDVLTPNALPDKFRATVIAQARPI